MPPQSRGNGLPKGFHSKSTPNLTTLSSLDSDRSAAPNPPSAKTDAPSNPLSPTDTGTSPSESASVEDNLSAEDPFTLDASGTSSVSDDEFDFDDVDADADDAHNGRSTSTDGGTSSQPRRPLYSHASRSHSHLPHTSSALFPPFYNRPPTPLPPSPSLTSLLRPSFSAQTSRPTTPDSSDVEGINPSAGSRRAASTAAPTASTTTAMGGGGAGSTSTGTKRAPSATSGVSNGGGGGGTGTGTGTGTPTNNLTASFASATLVPRASPKVPTYEYYGFFIYLASSFAFLMYLLWAYLPRPFLHQLGIYYYPNRWWALAVPAWLVVLVVYIYVALASYNLGYLTLPMRSSENMVDDAAQIATLDSRGRVVRKGKDGKVEKVASRKASGRHSSNGSVKGERGGSGFAVEPGTKVDWRGIWSESTDAVLDVPIGGVCEILYGDGRELDEDGEDVDGSVNGVV
ncbi:PIG-P domain-containing protein [Macrophomina phaseolina MS6]|uniref:PIG-P domain-containing protein n=1 Tax=Macrophomina phaseolina (strain MS6) TaxID=1126212 RepID=K2RMF9_MACPH|nr:PIG-P domain-containing protein [Macrophomina phaseolina MS6]